ncbi:MAG: ABC-F family ATP-binding cassette domain-containing protein [Porphyromonadaceae bacterium]|nr:ABC-F family ATP-binding cassette domain-containing protein [Porphyromonadaceae bacterium]
MVNYIQIENLSKSFGDKILFENISFTITDNHRVALIAKNGTGKTTLLNLIAGRESLDSGNIIFKNDLRIGYLDQSPTFPADLSVIDACLQTENEIVRTIAEYEKLLQNPDKLAESNILSKMDFLNAWDYEIRIKQILSVLKINDFNQKISELSGGQIKRIALANALINEPDLLILDEPTNHLDIEMIEWLEEFLRNSNRSLLMVTHDRYFLDRVCNHILEIDNHSMYSYSGNYSYYLEKRQERIDSFIAETESAKNIYRRELEWMRSTPQARTSKSKGRIDRFYELEERAKQRQSNEKIRLNVKASYIGSKIFEAKSVYKRFGDLKILEDFNYVFTRYEKLGIVGNNGTGKSTFIKLLLGEIEPDKGHFDIGETVMFGYYSQDGIQFDEQIKVLDVVRNIAEEIDLGNGKKLTASQFLQHFLFTPESQHNYVYKLSGGEKRRLYLCTVLMKNPNFLVLDEPTNDLDIVTLNILEEYLQTFKGCLIIISHDRYFMDKVVDHLFVFEGNGVIRDFPGNYTQYREDFLNLTKGGTSKPPALKETRKNEQSSSADISSSIEQSERGVRKITYKERLELEALEKEIPELEQEKADLEAKLSSGEITDSDEIIQISEQFGKVSDLLDEKEMRWLELSEI